MADALDRLRLGEETFESIMVRLASGANAGVDPDSPVYADVVPGAIASDFYGCCALEFDRVYDRINVELPQSVIPSTATGDWLDQWADSLGLERNDEVAASGTVTIVSTSDAVSAPLAQGVQVSTVAASDEQEEIVFVTATAATLPAAGGSVTVAIVAEVAGSTGNVPANSVTVMQVDRDDVASVTNPQAITGGADVEDDEHLCGRVKRKLAGSGGAGNSDSCVEWGTSHPGVGYVTVQPNFPNPGGVRMICTDLDNNELPASIIASLQQVIDPPDSAGDGYGKAPIGATVVVATPEAEAVTVSATLDLATGYSIDGAGATRGVKDDVTAAVRTYIDSLPPGGDVVRNKLIAAIVDVDGVLDVTALDPSTNVSIASLEIATLAAAPTLAAA